MHESILIKSPLCVSSSKCFRADILIKDGKILQIGSLKVSAEKIIDGKNLILLPGIIDTHVHFREPGLTWKEDLLWGSKAALSGGVTSIFEMPNTSPPTISLKNLKEKKELAASKCLVNFNFFLGVTNDNIEELNSAVNIPGIKLFMGSSTGNLLVSDPKSLENIFKLSKHLIAVHAEDEEIIKKNKNLFGLDTDPLSHLKIRPVEAAVTSLKKALALSQKFKSRLHFLHITSKEEVTILQSIKRNHLISCEVCPQHFLLNAPEAYLNLKSYAKVNPPIRYENDSLSLIDGLKSGTINVLGTDHAPHTKEEKSLPFNEAPSGMPGIETLLPLMLNCVNQGIFELTDVVKYICENPCKIFKIKNKGFIQEGMDADLVLCDMNKLKIITGDSLFTKCKWSAFEGLKIKGWPVITIINGQIGFQEGDILATSPGKEIQINS